jgi:hypothetical protein
MERSDTLACPVAFTTDIRKAGSFLVKPSGGSEMPALVEILMFTQVSRAMAAWTRTSKRVCVIETCITRDWFREAVRFTRRLVFSVLLQTSIVVSLMSTTKDEFCMDRFT